MIYNGKAVTCFHALGNNLRNGVFFVTIAIYIRVGLSQAGRVNTMIRCEVKVVCFFCQILTLPMRKLPYCLIIFSTSFLVIFLCFTCHKTHDFRYEVFANELHIRFILSLIRSCYCDFICCIVSVRNWVFYPVERTQFVSS